MRRLAFVAVTLFAGLVALVAVGVGNAMREPVVTRYAVAVPGNHDHWHGIDVITGAFACASIPLLANSSLRVLIVSSGLGTSVLPMRFDVPPEIVIVTLEPV